VKPTKRQLARNSSVVLQPTSPIKTQPKVRKITAISRNKNGKFSPISRNHMCDPVGEFPPDTPSEIVKEDKCKEIISLDFGELTGEQSGFDLIQPEQDCKILNSPIIPDLPDQSDRNFTPQSSDDESFDKSQASIIQLLAAEESQTLENIIPHFPRAHVEKPNCEQNELECHQIQGNQNIFLSYIYTPPMYNWTSR